MALYVYLYILIPDNWQYCSIFFMLIHHGGNLQGVGERQVHEISPLLVVFILMMRLQLRLVS